MSLFYLHLLTTLMMTGLIWFVQVVHYPLFHKVGTKDFVDYEAWHTRRTGWVVAPLMLTELGTGLWLLWAQGFLPWTWINLGLLGVIWLSTAVIQMPLHLRLGAGYEAALVRKLVRTNWIRTVAWSLRVGVLGVGSLGFGG